MTERDDYDLLTRAELTKFFGVDERTVDRMVADRLLPKPVKYGRQPRWRWGVLKRWMEATEFLQGMGLDLPPEEDEQVRQTQTKPVDSQTTGDSGDSVTSGPKRKV